MKRFALAFACAVQAAAQSRPPAQQRDLTIEKIESEAAPPKKPTVPLSYAVVIGISRYPTLTASQQLHFSVRDAQTIAAGLSSPEGGNFKAENVHILLDNQATLAAMRREIDNWLPSVAKADDRVLVYFAGHGLLDKGKGYLIPSDVTPGDVAHTAYSMDELGSVIGGKIRARYKILFTDACHSGAITPDELGLRSLDQSIFSLTASREREQSFESPELGGGHGLFTYYVDQGLRGAADANHDGVVTADELAEYVRTEVRKATEGKQTPTSDRGSWDPQMFLALSLANVNPAAPPPPTTGTLVFTTNMDDVELFVDGVSKGILYKDRQFELPGLQTGEHTIQGVHMGYVPDGPRPEMVYPGQRSTVSIKILIARRRDKAVVDQFDKGMEYYQKGDQDNYRKAAGLFENALKTDSTYSQAAFFLGNTYNALFDEEKAQSYFKRAIAIDPDYLEARVSYAGMLFDIGDIDEANRQIDAVLVRQPQHALALTMRARSYNLKALYPRSIDAARQAIQLAPGNAEPHLWLGDSLRLSDKYADAKSEYVEYLELSDFDSHLAGKLNYYGLGFLIGFGKRKRASQHDIWKDLRSLAYFGMCDCDYQLKQFESAIGYCQKALAYSPRDAYAHYDLGRAYMNEAINAGSVAGLEPALRHFEQVLAIDPDLAEAKFAKKNIETIKSQTPGH
ncbi:MAG TPA: tetratricopeptide repeat protein [Bryobacteraceae bacterium]|nr:tetratricopeptide repeat protein [Bryobacteraceae bacterium]